MSPNPGARDQPAGNAGSRQTVAERAAALIRARAERVTRSRVDILSVLIESPAALSHQQIIARLDSQSSVVDRVTVYRTLDWLIGAGLAHRVASESRAWHFGVTGAAGEGHAHRHDAPHAHFECRRCDRLYCIESSIPPEPVDLPEGFELQQASLKFEGICAECAKSPGDK